MSESLREAVRALLDEGGGVAVGPIRVLPVVTLESEHRYAVDADLRWVVLPPDGGEPRVADGEGVHLLHEALEWKRDDFEQAVEAAARRHGLPAEALAFSFPAVPLVRAILTKRAAYLVRLALQWVRPTELRELRAEIVAVSKAPELPRPLKDLAARLIVPA